MGHVNAWTPEEDAILRRVYPTGEDCSEYLPKRSSMAIFKRASRLGLSRYAFMETWSDEEVLYLLEMSKTKGVNNLALSLGRTRIDVRKKAESLGITLVDERCTPGYISRRSSWTEDELRILQENLDKDPFELQVLIPGRSPGAIRVQLSRSLGLKRNTWTKDELDILRRFYPSEGIGVVSRLPGRTSSACVNRANLLGLKRMSTDWTSSQDDILVKFFPLECEQVVSRLPSKSVTACVLRARELGLTKGFGWAKVEDDILCKYFPKEGANVALRLPRRTIAACLNRARELGLNPASKICWSDEEKVILLQFYPLEGLDVALRLPGRTSYAIRRMASVMGLRREDKVEC